MQALLLNRYAPYLHPYCSPKYSISLQREILFPEGKALMIWNKDIQNHREGLSMIEFVSAYKCVESRVARLWSMLVQRAELS